jgi:hypothetical protein
MKFSRLGRMLVEAGDSVSPTIQVSTDALMKRGLKPLGKTPSGASSDEVSSGRGGYPVPKQVAAAAKKGLELRKKREALQKAGKIGASESLGGTDIGVSRAVQLADGGKVSLSSVKRMAAYFSRHEVDKKGEGFGDDSEPSPGYVAWLLWGGDPAAGWVKRVLAKEEQVTPFEDEGYPILSEAAAPSIGRANKAKPIRGRGRAVANIFSTNDVTLTVRLNLEDLQTLFNGQEVEIEARDLKQRDEQNNIYKVVLSYKPRGEGAV